MATSLTSRGLAPFSPQDIIDELRRRGTGYAESTIRTHIVHFMCANSPSERGGGGGYPDLWRVDRGRYVLASERGSAQAQSRPSPPSSSNRAGNARPDAVERPWSWEGRVQEVFVDHLRGQGWDIVATADTATRASGPDVHARAGATDLVVEVKGLPEHAGASAATQARHYAGGALLTALLAWADQPTACIGLVFPDAATFRNLIRRLRAPLERLEMSVWFVHDDGRVVLWLDGGLPVAGDAQPEVGVAEGVRSLSSPDSSADDVDEHEPARRFGAAMRASIQRLKDEIGYHPARWVQMLAEHGPVEAARRLLHGSDVSDGFVTLWEHDRLDESVEWCVLAHPSLFDGDERQLAYQRLRQYDAPVDRWLVDRLGRKRP